MKNNLGQKGFTLIELLIAIFLVSVGLIGVISFFNASLQSQFDAKNEVIAAGLAQEATELVRNIVDYNYLNDNKWYLNLSGVNGSGICGAIDVTSLGSHACVSAEAICISQSDGRYYGCSGSSGLASTDFNRNIIINLDNTSGPDLDNKGCLNVAAKVSWSGGDKNTVANDIICKPRQ